MEFGFSWRGFVVFLLPMLINFAYFALPPSNTKEEEASETKILSMIEQITRIGYAALICILVSQKESTLENPAFWIGLAFLVLYYIVWIRYFVGGRDIALLGKSFCHIPMPLAVFPVLYFICMAFWLHNYYAVVVMIVFGVVHNVISYQTLYSE